MVKTEAPTPTTAKTAPRPAPQREPMAPAFSPSEGDIIDDILARVIAMAPGFQAAIALQISREAREHWGGDRPYISRALGQGRSQRNDSIKQDHRAGAHIHLLERRYGLKRSRLWEIINS